jgi:hypothetical protein
LEKTYRSSLDEHFSYPHISDQRDKFALSSIADISLLATIKGSSEQNG